MAYARDMELFLEYNQDLVKFQKYPEVDRLRIMYQKVLQTSTRENREEMKEYLKNQKEERLASHEEDHTMMAQDSYYDERDYWGYGEQTRAPVQQQQQVMRRAQCARCQCLLLIPENTNRFQCPRCRMINQRRVVQMQPQQNYYPQQRI